MGVPGCPDPAEIVPARTEPAAAPAAGREMPPRPRRARIPSLGERDRDTGMSRSTRDQSVKPIHATTGPRTPEHTRYQHRAGDAQKNSVKSLGKLVIRVGLRRPIELILTYRKRASPRNFVDSGDCAVPTVAVSPLVDHADHNATIR